MNGWVYPDRMNDVFTGAKLFRNWDHSFQMALQKKTSERKISISVTMQETDDGFILMEDFVITVKNLAKQKELAELIPSDIDKAQVLANTIQLKTEITQQTTGSSFRIIIPKIPANDPDKSRENILRQLSKSGDTPFLVRDIDTGGNEKYFFTSQQLNELRRGLLEAVLTKSISSDTPATSSTHILAFPFPHDPWHFENNISNHLAIRFYKRHGLENQELAVEKRKVSGRIQVMITKHCIQYELGFCARFGGTFPSQFSEPFALQDGTNRFDLEFDCKNCMMRVFKEE